MSTFTLNRDFDTNDCLFVALNDSCYADWKESQNQFWNDRREENSSLLDSIISLFFK